MKMQKPKLRPIALFLLTLIGAGSIALGFRGKSHERYAEEKAQHETECAAWIARGGAPEACNINAASGNRPKLIPIFTETRDQIRMARAAIAFGREMESSVGIPTLGAALDTAMKLDRFGTPLAEMVAASLVKQVLDAIEGVPETKPFPDSKLAAMPINTKPLASSSALRKILSGAGGLRSGRHPLEGERLYTLTSMQAMREEAAKTPAVMFVGGSFASATTADLMHDYASTSHAMEAAILQGDEAQCHSAATSGRLPTSMSASTSWNPAGRLVAARFGTAHGVLCEKLIEVVNTAKRFEKVRRDRLSVAS